MKAAPGESACGFPSLRQYHTTNKQSMRPLSSTKPKKVCICKKNIDGRKIPRRNGRFLRGFRFRSPPRRGRRRGEIYISPAASSRRQAGRRKFFLRISVFCTKQDAWIAEMCYDRGSRQAEAEGRRRHGEGADGTGRRASQVVLRRSGTEVPRYLGWEQQRRGEAPDGAMRRATH